jgi:mono/diheme cytochrome c family protein
MDENIGRQLVIKRCAKCHSLERVFKSFKDEEGWTKTVNRMALIDAPNIRDYDAKQIIYFLLKQQEERKGSDLSIIEEEIGKTLIDKKCSLCHNLERVYKSVKNEEEWRITVERIGEIVEYLTSNLKSPN